MKRNKIVGLTIFGVLLLCNTNLYAQDKLDKWEGYTTIELKGESQYKSVPLDGYVYRYAKSDLSDVRIVDTHNDFVPFFVKTGFVEESKSEDVFTTSEINFFEEFNDDKSKRDSITDYQVITAEEELFGTSLRLKIDSLDYSNQVEVFGRNEKGDWVLILKDTIYDIDDLEKTDIKFAREYNYKFYRVKIIDNSSQIDIKRCDLVSNVVEKENKKYLKKESLEFSAEHRKTGSIIKIKNVNNLKLKEINLLIEGNFDRQFEFYSYSDYDGDFEKDIDKRYPQYQGNIYNFKYNDVDMNKTNIPLQSLSTEKTFYIKILNLDNKPLKIKEIQGEYFIDYLVFEKTESKDYRLYFGNTESDTPSYDIKKFKKYIEKETLDTCGLGELILQDVKDIQEEKEINFKFIFNIFIIIAALVMGVLLVFKLKKK